MIKPRLVMHYAPGVLVMLRREPCPGRLAGWSSQPKHGPNCGCDRNHDVYKFISATEVLDDMKPGLLELSWIRRDEL